MSKSIPYEKDDRPYTRYTVGNLPAYFFDSIVYYPVTCSGWSFDQTAFLISNVEFDVKMFTPSIFKIHHSIFNLTSPVFYLLCVAAIVHIASLQPFLDHR